jgi:radical SAM/Cys-rich protein
MIDTLPLLTKNITFPPLKKDFVDTFQVNLGYLCNQQCKHCHVNAGPNRKEVMGIEIIDKILDIISTNNNITTLDLTGGAPEMNPHFKYFIEKASKQVENIIVRSNLTILVKSEYHDLVDFFVKYNIQITASLPCYLEDNVNSQRGKGVYSDSIKAIQNLNAVGYGADNSRLILNLVYNPVTPHLPPNQKDLESDYKRELFNSYNIKFNNLYTITNMPISRFGSTLVSKGEFESYMDLLLGSFNPKSLQSVMCKNMINIGWDGYLYDCDFNQMLGLKITNKATTVNIKDLEVWQDADQDIVVANHCYGCTAGQGSSCGGALS